jgi:hypothetical protein
VAATPVAEEAIGANAPRPRSTLRSAHGPVAVRCSPPSSKFGLAQGDGVAALEYAAAQHAPRAPFGCLAPKLSIPGARRQSDRPVGLLRR